MVNVIWFLLFHPLQLSLAIGEISVTSNLQRCLVLIKSLVGNILCVFVVVCSKLTEEYRNVKLCPVCLHNTLVRRRWTKGYYCDRCRKLFTEYKMGKVKANWRSFPKYIKVKQQ